jgi:hypothetical protein
MSIQSANSRLTAYNTCMAEHNSQTYIDAQEAQRLTAVQNHYERIIVNWCNQDGNTATSDNLVVRTSQVSSDWVNSKVEMLTTAGYVVTEGSGNFTVTLV